MSVYRLGEFRHKTYFGFGKRWMAFVFEWDTIFAQLWHPLPSFETSSIHPPIMYCFMWKWTVFHDKYIHIHIFLIPKETFKKQIINICWAGGENILTYSTCYLIVILFYFFPKSCSMWMPPHILNYFQLVVPSGWMTWLETKGRNKEMRKSGVKINQKFEEKWQENT